MEKQNVEMTREKMENEALNFRRSLFLANAIGEYENLLKFLPDNDITLIVKDFSGKEGKFLTGRGSVFCKNIESFVAGMEAAKKKNIVKWLESITEEQYRDCIIICIECENCPAKEFCQADDSDKCCEEEFYKWSLLECEEEGGSKC